MDWIDNLWNKLKNRINNLSLKKALILYIIISIGIIGLLIALTQKACNEWASAIMSKYYEGYKLGVIDEAQTYVKIFDYSNFNKADRTQLEIAYFIQTWSTVIYSLAGIIGVSYLYYNNKLKEPIRLLSEAADEVGRYNLDIEICYEKGDEMGRLCRAFDSMRRQLIANNQKMWDMMEEQKRINAAFAHDLRTPLTVLRGYADLLSKYIPEGKISEEKLLSTVKLMSDHIGRLEIYSNTMKQINSLDELAVSKRPVEGRYFIEKLREASNIIKGDKKITIELITGEPEELQGISLDEEIFMEVFDNLLSNALRYAEGRIEIILLLSDDKDKLILSVADDGKGFSDTDLRMATKAYYTDGKGKDSNHFGIGLYISKLLCEKHGGCLTLENGLNKGAVVTAEFKVG